MRYIDKKYIGIKMLPIEKIINNSWKDELTLKDGEEIYWTDSKDFALQLCNRAFKIDKQRQNRAINQAIWDVYEKYGPVDKETLHRLVPRPKYNITNMALLFEESASNLNLNEDGRGQAPGIKAEVLYCPTDEALRNIQEAEYSCFSAYNTYTLENMLNGLLARHDNEYKYPISSDYQPKLAPTIQDPMKRDAAQYTHCGAETFDANKFREVSTYKNLKPSGGFWASRQGAQRTWEGFCDYEYQSYDTSKKLDFSLKPGAKVFEVHTLEDVAFLLQQYPMPWRSNAEGFHEYPKFGLPCIMIDYDAMSRDYDGIEYFHSEIGNAMGPWDCDSICIFNPDVMEIKERSQSKDRADECLYKECLYEQENDMLFSSWSNFDESPDER